MATLVVINEKEEITQDVDGYIAPLVVQGFDDYSFFRGNISQETRATHEDFFDINAKLIAVRVVGGDFTPSDWVMTISTFGFYGIYKAYQTYTKKPPGIPSFSTEQSPNNTLGSRSNEQRLGKRIEDIWGNDPKVFPSLLSSYTRFDNNRNEIECSTFCVGAGNYLLTNIKDREYGIQGTNGAALQVYQKFPSNPNHVTIGGVPTEYLTPQTLNFSPISTIRNEMVSGKELLNASEIKEVIFGEASSGWVNLIGSEYYPQISVVTRNTVDGITTATINLMVFADPAPVFSNFIVGDSVLFKGFSNNNVYVPNYGYTNDCSVLSSIVTGFPLPWEMSITITYTAGNPVCYWDSLTIGTYHTAIWQTNSSLVPAKPNPPYTATPEITVARGSRCSISNSLEQNYSTVVIEFENGVANYLCNFEFPRGTTTTNTAKATVTYSNGTQTTQSFSFTQDPVASKRVGYSVELSFTFGTVYATSFYWEKQTTSDDSMVLRDVYRTQDLTNWYDDNTCILRLERGFNSIYGSNEMKLSVDATRYVYQPTINPDYTWQLGSTYLASNDPKVFIPNLHLNQYNGRKSASSLDITSLNTALSGYATVNGGSGYPAVGGITFDESNLKYEDELKNILSSFECDVFQTGSKIYTSLERTDGIAMQFTHRDIVPGTFKLSRIFKKTNAHDGVELVYKNSNGDNTTLCYPTGITITNPLKISLKAIHSEYQAKLTLYREWFKLMYQKTGCQFTATALGRQAAPGMVISVVDGTREQKSDGEILSTETVAGKLVATVSQLLPTTISNVTITDDKGSATTWPVTRTSDYSFTFSTTPTVSVYTDWEQQKTRYQAYYNSAFDKYIVVGVDVKSYDEVEITCINYDDRYYQYDNVASRP